MKKRILSLLLVLIMLLGLAVPSYAGTVDQYGRESIAPSEVEKTSYEYDGLPVYYFKADATAKTAVLVRPDGETDYPVFAPSRPKCEPGVTERVS